MSAIAGAGASIDIKSPFDTPTRALNTGKTAAVAGPRIPKAPIDIFLSKPLYKEFVDYAVLHLDLLIQHLKSKNIFEGSKTYNTSLVSLMMMNPYVLQGLEFLASEPGAADLKLTALCTEARKRLKSEVCLNLMVSRFFRTEEEKLQTLKAKFSDSDQALAFSIFATLESSLSQKVEKFEEIPEAILQVLIRHKDIREPMMAMAAERGHYDTLSLCYKAEVSTLSEETRVAQLLANAEKILIEEKLFVMPPSTDNTFSELSLSYYYKLCTVLRKKYPTMTNVRMEEYIVIEMVKNPSFFDGMGSNQDFLHLCTAASKKRRQTLKHEDNAMANEINDLLQASRMEKMKTTAATPLAVMTKSVEIREKFFKSLSDLEPTFDEDDKRGVWTLCLSKNPVLLTAFKSREENSVSDSMDCTLAEYLLVFKMQPRPEVLSAYEKVLESTKITFPTTKDLKQMTEADQKRLSEFVSAQKDLSKNAAAAKFLAIHYQTARAVTQKKAQLAPPPAAANRICLNGCKNEVTKKCANCFTYYCSVECQKKDWPKHKKVCKVIK